MATDTLIEAPLQSRRAAADAGGESSFAPLRKNLDGGRVFRIRSADSYVQRQAANELLQDRYAWRGYHAVSLPADQTSNRITLSAFDDATTIGTITVALDGPEGLSAEDAFPAEIGALRREGLRVCEFTKLAIDPDTGSKRVLAALFHVAYMVAHKIRGYDVLVMEVNPRHVRYYQRMLGARVIGEQRLNRFVNAPAVLLSMPFDYVAEQIAEFGGRDDLAAEERSLYPFGFSQREEQGILGRLMAAQQTGSASVN
ncbi:MAG: long-chain N-acyl amino acid synthase [Burkholderiales bacterium]|nr:long-chain N-acyl amino acid synthase [Burkholderiales bacterium]